MQRTFYMPKGQDFFSLPELLLLALILANALALACAVWALATDRRFGRERSLGILRAMGIADALYLALLVLTGFQRPEPIPAPRIGHPLCLGHRCITVEEVTNTHTASATTYAVTLRLTNSSRYAARDSLQGVYLVDDRGRRYPPAPDASARSLTAELEPGEAATTRRMFALPPDARATGFVVQRGGGPPLRCLIIGGPCWFPAPKEPPVVID
jgi:hypothetical protein